MGFEGEAYAETDETDETDAYGGRRDSSFLRRYEGTWTKQPKATERVPKEYQKSNPESKRVPSRNTSARLAHSSAHASAHASAHSSAHSSSPPCPTPFLTFPRFPL